MGIYVRRSITAGPFRFNVSRSGLGVSTGVPGFRVGSGPRGNFVSVGGNGVRYRTTVNPQVSARPAAPTPAPHTGTAAIRRAARLDPDGGRDRSHRDVARTDG